MSERISLAEFAQIVMCKAQVSDFTRVVSVGTRVRDDKSFHVVFCKDDFGRESVIEVPYYVDDECEV